MMLETENLKMSIRPKKSLTIPFLKIYYSHKLITRTANLRFSEKSFRIFMLLHLMIGTRDWEKLQSDRAAVPLKGGEQHARI
jgi:hypothetical protein